MNRTPKPGETVRWNTPQGETEGAVEKIVTREAHVKGHVAKASQEHPEVLVSSNKSGKEAIHKPESLKPAK